MWRQAHNFVGLAAVLNTLVLKKDHAKDELAVIITDQKNKLNKKEMVIPTSIMERLESMVQA